ncbi:MAG: hypothetical protein PHP28_02555 [Actinomycetota bacterium]|nr:hypothetical protein [Actinomycetota bacterium]MDD5666639.1 hypothetical protein [Actinomycetota bacterium]
MKSWQESLAEKIDEIVWSHWAALGAYVAAEPCRGSVIDPEALLVATSAFGRDDARIFDEAMDWMIANHGLLKAWRLKRISRAFEAGTRRALGAVLDYAAGDIGKDIFPGVRQEARKALQGAEAEELFRREKVRYDAGRRQPDEIFLAWKLLRGSPRIRRHAGKPDLANPANLMLRLRDCYGSGARADVMTYLLTNEGGSSNGIASRIKYQQGWVYGVLEDLVGAGIAHKKGGRGKAYYWIDRARVAASLGLGEKLPAYFVWGDVFRAFDMVVSDWWGNQEAYENEFLAAERMRDLAAEVVPMLRGAGEPLSRIPFPDPGKLKGAEHTEALVSFMDNLADVLRSHTLD